MGTHPIFESDFDCLTDMSDSEEDLDCVNWWLDFMADAGIPPNAAAQYAVNFADQRIPRDKEIITELSSDEWRDLGVELLGDRLALKNFAKNGKKKKSRSKTVRVKSRVREPSPVDEITNMISKAKELAKPIERQSVDKERVKSANPFRKSSKIDQEEQDAMMDDEAVYATSAVEDESPVQFSVTLGNRKRVAQTRGASPVEPKITRTFGSIQENVVSSSAKVNVTFGSISNQMKKQAKESTLVSDRLGKSNIIKTGNKPIRAPYNPGHRGPKVSCSSFDQPKIKLQKSGISSRLGKSQSSAKARLGNKSVKSRLGL